MAALITIGGEPCAYTFQIMERLAGVLEQHESEKTDIKKKNRKFLKWIRKMRPKHGNLVRWKGIYKKY